jgi:hypothetical protein
LAEEEPEPTPQDTTIIEMTPMIGAGAAKPEPNNENEESKIEITA